MTTYTAPMIGPTDVASGQVRTGLEALRSPLNGGLDSTDNVQTSETFVAGKLRSGALSQSWREASDGLAAYFPVVVESGATPSTIGTRTNLYRPDHMSVRFFTHATSDLAIRINADFRLVKAPNLTAGNHYTDVICGASIYLDGVTVGGTLTGSVNLAYTGPQRGALSVNGMALSQNVSAGWHEVSVLCDFSGSLTSFANPSLVHLRSFDRSVVVEAVYR